MAKKKIAILGSTGSVGKNALEVVKDFQDFFCVKALACFSDIDTLEEQVKIFKPELVAVYDEKKAYELEKRFFERKIKVCVEKGKEGLCNVASFSSVDLTLVSLRGSLALDPLIAAIQAKKDIALATKETLVAAGDLVMRLACEYGVKILPVDSEHNAIFQIFENITNKDVVQKIILTASGGPFFFMSEEDRKKITPLQALAHPTYKMGKKISVDSSTLMNKGFEVIEAHHLFGIDIEKIEVVVHPQSVIHGFLEFSDHNLMAALSESNMKLPIQYAFWYPKRKKNPQIKPFDFFSKKHSTWTFFSWKDKNFPCLELAYMAAKNKKSYPCFLNAANEVLVKRFLAQKISWNDIPIKLEKLISSHSPIDVLNWQHVTYVENEANIAAETV